MQTIFKGFYGSHLYGVAKPTSDKDYKGIFLFSLDELVKCSPPNVQWKDEEKNEEHEMYYAKRFADLLASGQTVAYSMLFSPQNMWLESSHTWEKLVANKDKVVSKALKPFVGYALSQSQKYSLKGEKLRTLLDFQRVIHSFFADKKILGPTGVLLTPYFTELCLNFSGRDGVRLWSDTRGESSVRLIDVCGKSFGETTPLKLWLPVVDKLVSKYGTRAMEAKESNGQDLKALYHAVRIISEMNEILRDGTITYPRPERELLLDIRNGKLTNGDISVVIDKLMAEGNELFVTSTLRETPDYKFIEDWYTTAQIESIQGEISASLHRPKSWGSRCSQAISNLFSRF